MSLAKTERALVGLLTVLEVLHSADRCRVAAEPEKHLDEGVVDGLFLACRGWLSGLVGRLGQTAKIK